MTNPTTTDTLINPMSEGELPVSLSPGQPSNTQTIQGNVQGDAMTTAMQQARQIQTGNTAATAPVAQAPVQTNNGGRLLPGTQSVSRVPQNTNRRQGQNADGTFQKAEFWLNIGRVLNLHMEDQAGNVSVVQQFLSLPSGVPLERQEIQPTTSSNLEFAKMNGGKNAMINQLWELARTLRPGEHRDLTLNVRLSRVNAEKPDLTYPENNPWIVTEPLVAG